MSADAVYTSNPTANSTSDPSSHSSPAAPEATAEASPAPVPRLSPLDSADFVLHPSERAKGLAAAQEMLSQLRNEESRRSAEEALETLATVISGGRIDGLDFPWQQVRAYHGAAALTILKAKGAPGRIEALRCRRDSTRSYRVVPDNYPTRQVQKIRSTLHKVIEQCSELGFVDGDETEAPKGAARTRRSTPRGRILAAGELRALTAACASDANAEGSRDAVFFALVHCGLKIAEITALGLDGVRWSDKTGRCGIVVRPRGGGRGRRMELANDELIHLENWLDHRGDADGPLLCTLGRGGKVEGKRLTTALLKKLCEERARQAEVQPFTPNDLSKSAEALLQHRRSIRRKTSREQNAAFETLLFEDAEQPEDDAETIRFPFLGLGL